MTSRPKKIMNTAEIFAAASRQMRSASDTKVPRPQEFEDDSAEEDLPTVSETLQNPIPKTIGPYEIRGTVGEGAFSLVKLAFHQPTRQYYACKVIERVRLKKNNLEARFTCEIRVHQQMHHHGIVDLVDILEDQHFFYVFLEFCPGGELFQHIVDNGRLTEDRAKPIMVQVLDAVRYIHMMGVSHRDLKPENLLLDQYGHTKISDFGLSRFLDKNGLAATPCGSPCYASPECISGAPYDGRTSDCWSVGVIFYAMVTGQLPWTKRNQTQLFEQIRRGEYTIPGYLTSGCRDLIQSLMCVDNKKRLTAAQALEHPFLKDVKLPLEQMMARPSAVISLKHVDEFFGLCDSTVDVTLERIPTAKPMDFEATIRQIVGPVSRARARPRRQVAANRMSTAVGKVKMTVNTVEKKSGSPRSKAPVPKVPSKH